MRYSSITDRLADLGSEKWALHIHARQMQASGTEIIQLTIGEPDMPPDASLLAEAQRAMNAGRYRYSNGRGEPSVVSALTARYARRRPDDFSAAPSSTEAAREPRAPPRMAGAAGGASRPGLPDPPRTRT